MTYHIYTNTLLLRIYRHHYRPPLSFHQLGAPWILSSRISSLRAKVFRKFNLAISMVYFFFSRSVRAQRAGAVYRRRALRHCAGYVYWFIFPLLIVYGYVNRWLFNNALCDLVKKILTLWEIIRFNDSEQSRTPANGRGKRERTNRIT